MKFSKAFTLAETLMVIGIIGVVAALTLPNLNNSTRDIEYVSMFKKSVSDIQTALDIAKDKYGDYDTWFPSNASATQNVTTVGERLSEYILPMKTCGLNTGRICFANSNTTSISGSAINNTNYDSNANIYKFVLKDGSSLAIISPNSFIVDLDGSNKGYNTVGIDIFSITISDEGNTSTTAGMDSGLWDNSNAITSCRSGDANNCTYWISEFDNNDYIRCADLTKTKTTCN